MDELLKLDFTLVADLHASTRRSRDLMRASRAEWHDEYTLPSLWRFYQPNRKATARTGSTGRPTTRSSGSDNYRLWMRFVNEYKNRGGRVGTGSDSGYIYKLYGFALHPRDGAAAGGGLPSARGDPRGDAERGRGARAWQTSVGSIEPGKLADLVVVEENPVANLKVLYGTGAIKLNDANDVVRVGGVATRSRTASSTTRRSCSPTCAASCARRRTRKATRSGPSVAES